MWKYFCLISLIIWHNLNNFLSAKIMTYRGLDEKTIYSFLSKYCIKQKHSGILAARKTCSAFIVQWKREAGNRKESTQRQQRRKRSPSAGLTEKVKMETRNKRDATGESSAPSDLHSVTHTSAKYKTAIPLSRLIIYEAYFAAKNSQFLLYTHRCTHTH